MREGLEERTLQLLGITPAEAFEAVAQAEKKFAKEGAQVAAVAKEAFEKAKVKGQEVIAATLENGKDVVNKVEGGTAPTLSPVQMALNQRFEKPEVHVNQSVEEALKERYTPMNKRDNSVLRGV